jgi:aspartyl-tRNA(Asn)/glutamyl-tRNA(Gln) amidotransferase subunit A
VQTIKELRKKLDSKEISSTELAKHCFEKIKKDDEKIESFITLTEEKALETAEKAQLLIDKGESKSLTGIPSAIKDNICTEGIHTTCASKMLENFIPPYDATVIRLLKAQTAVIPGKVNMDEFAMGASTQTSYYKKTKNPRDLERVPGGSSGGSAAAVAGGLVPCALGSDTGGSIRQPAAFCGVYGMKPTYGRVSRYGLVAFASSLDQIGPLTNSAEDCGIILNVISGYDRKDGTSAKISTEDFTSECGKSQKGTKIALPKEFLEGADKDVIDAILKTADYYKSLGCEIIEASMPSFKYAIAVYYLIASAEAASNLSRYDGIKFGYRSEKGETYDELVRNTRSEGFGDEVKRRILLGNYALSSGFYDAYYGKACALKQQIKEEYSNIFEKADVILTPTSPTPAFKLGENITDPVKMYLADICTVTVNIAGLPAISMPCGESKGLPIGASIVGKPWQESKIIGLADALKA